MASSWSGIYPLRTWLLVGAGTTISCTSYVSYCGWRQRRVSSCPPCSEDYLDEVEVARTPCQQFKGYDVVVRNLFYRAAKPPSTSLADRLRACLPMWMRADDQTNNTLTNAIPSHAEVTRQENRLSIVRHCESKAENEARGTPTITSKESSRPTRDLPLERYCSMTIEPSLTVVDIPSRNQVLQQVTDRATTQTLVKCVPSALDTARSIDGTLTPAVQCKSDPTVLCANYLRNMVGGLALLPFPIPQLRVCFLGVGGGSLPLFLQHYFPHRLSKVDLVDIEPEVFRFASRFMGMRTLVATQNTECHSADAAAFLRGREVGTIDLLFVDVFRGSEPPRYLTTAEFTNLVRATLSNVGVAVFNLPCRNDQFVAECRNTFGANNVLATPCRGSCNSIVFAAKTGNQSMCHRHFIRRCDELQRVYGLPFDLGYQFPLLWQWF